MTLQTFVQIVPFKLLLLREQMQVKMCGDAACLMTAGSSYNALDLLQKCEMKSQKVHELQCKFLLFVS